MHTPTRVGRRLVAGLCLAAGLAGAGATVASPGSAAPQSPGPAARAHDGEHGTHHGTHRGKRHVDGRSGTASRAQVTNLYQTQWLPAQTMPVDWTGSADACSPGAPSAAAQAATLAALNVTRTLTGLAPIRFSSDLNAQAQQAALLMAANDALDHDPSSSWSCWTQLGHDAAGSSNLALSTPSITAGGTVAMYMDDAGTGNVDAGHRRWILDPTLTVAGNGLTATTDALYVFGPRKRNVRSPAWVSWPAAGWFPTQMEPDGRWSLGSGDPDADFSHARVVVRVGGQRLPVSLHPVTNGYGLNTIVFEVVGATTPGQYDVTVSGIKHAAASRYQYSVKLFAS